MKIKIRILITILITTFITSSVHAESAKSYFDEAVLATKTKTALIGEKSVSAGSINVEVSKGIVQLSGFVGSDTEIAAALATAEKVEGAKEVLNALVVFSGSRSQDEAADDATISAKLKTELAKVEGLGSATDIIITIRLGQVLLAGFVKSEIVKTSAGEVANDITGVKKVHNLIAVK